MKILEKIIRDFIRRAFNISLESIRFERPPDREMGDIACTVCFDLAKHLKQAPRKIAEQFIESFVLPEEIEKVEIAGAGYLNFYLKRDLFARKLLASGHNIKLNKTEIKKVTVEHTSINPNKTPHVGHLRNSVLGDTIGRLSHVLGHDTLIQNYVDDTGVQVADVVIGLTEMKGLDLTGIKQITEPLHSYCWDIYSKVSDWYAEDPSREKIREETIRALESGEGPVADIGKYVAGTIAKSHVELLDRLSIRYDLVVKESDVIAFNLWSAAFEMMKNIGLVYFADEGEKKGCWVMSLSGKEMFSEMDDPDKILVRSNGTITYTGKDIGYHYWKCGLIDLDFNYEKFYQYDDNTAVWTTNLTGDTQPVKFNNADTLINVIDVRQSYPQKVVKESINSINPGINLHHFAYGMVALTPECAKELGIELKEEERGKKFVEMSGRKGIGVKADDLIEKMEEKASEKIISNNPDLPSAEVGNTAEMITIGALRYFLLKFNKNKLIAFDFEEALNFEGDSGPYIQYSLVRANSILKKVSRTFDVDDKYLAKIGTKWEYRAISNAAEADETWDIIYELSKFGEIYKQVFDSIELSILSGWIYSIAQKFNSYYHKYNILKETDIKIRDARLGVVMIYLEIIGGAVKVLGLPIPEKM